MLSPAVRRLRRVALEPIVGRHLEGWNRSSCQGHFSVYMTSTMVSLLPEPDFCVPERFASPNPSMKAVRAVPYGRPRRVLTSVVPPAVLFQIVVFGAVSFLELVILRSFSLPQHSSGRRASLIDNRVAGAFGTQSCSIFRYRQVGTRSRSCLNTIATGIPTAKRQSSATTAASTPVMPLRH